MAASDEVRAALTDALLEARRSCRPIGPLSSAVPGLDIDDAYDVQSRQVDHWLAAGDTVAGYKIGLVSEAMQAQMGVTEPDFGRVMSSSVQPAGALLDLREHICPLVEPELGFILAAPMTGPGVDAEDVLSCTAAVVPVLEVVDSRIADWDLTIVDTVADNASSGVVHVGTERVPPDLRTLREVECRLYVDGVEHGRGRASDVLGSPAEAAAWLVNELGRRGVAMQAGQLLLTGSMTRAVRIEAGRTYEATLGDLGSVRLDTVSGREAGTATRADREDAR